MNKIIEKAIDEIDNALPHCGCDTCVTARKAKYAAIIENAVRDIQAQSPQDGIRLLPAGELPPVGAEVVAWETDEGEEGNHSLGPVTDANESGSVVSVHNRLDNTDYWYNTSDRFLILTPPPEPEEVVIGGPWEGLYGCQSRIIMRDGKPVYQHSRREIKGWNDHQERTDTVDKMAASYYALWKLLTPEQREAAREESNE